MNSAILERALKTRLRTGTKTKEKKLNIISDRAKPKLNLFIARYRLPVIFKEMKTGIKTTCFILSKPER